jgi:diguanylate cyclase (GGDEF)-like protein
VGGDEFVVLLDEVESAEAAVFMARRLGRAISKPYSYGGVTASMSASIGIALGYPDPASTEFLIRDADDAMYQVKKRGGNDVAVYEGRRSESA